MNWKWVTTSIRQYWVPAVNNYGGYGRWAVAEFTDPHGMESDLAATIEAEVGRLIAAAAASPVG